MSAYFKLITLLLIIVSTVGTTFGADVDHAFRCGTAEVNELYPAKVDWEALREAHRALPDQRTDYNVGDTHVFWAWDLTQMPPVDAETPATCRAKGTYCFIWVADDQWGTTVDQTKVDQVLAAWEQQSPEGSVDPAKGIYQIAADTFGTPPDELDNNIRIHILFYDIGSFSGSSFDGYFNAYNQMTDEEAQSQGYRSNECEMIYLDCDPSDPGSPYMLGVLAHEFQHLIHWGADPDEETWVNEACSQLNWYLCGYGTDGAETAFANNPNDDLTEWGSTSKDYGQVFLFGLYLYQKYSGADGIRACVAQTANGFEGLKAGYTSLGWHWDEKDVFTDWALANFINDPSINNGRYSYDHITLPAFKISQTIDRYPTGEIYNSTLRWTGTCYRWINGTSQLNMNLGSAGDLRGFMVYSNTTDKHFIPRDPAFHGIQVANFGAEGAQVDLIVVNRNSTNSPTNFEFCATDAVADDSSPPYIMAYSPFGIQVSESTGTLLMNDELTDIDPASLTIKLNELSVVPTVTSLGNRMIQIDFLIGALPPETEIHVEVNASDVTGNVMSPHHYWFRTSDRTPMTLGVRLEMPANTFSAGDPCYLKAMVDNPGAPMTQVPLFVLLNVFGEFYSAPGWENIKEDVSWYTLDIQTGTTTQDVLPTFEWPDVAGPVSGLEFYSAITDTAFTQILGTMATWPFGWK